MLLLQEEEGCVTEEQTAAEWIEETRKKIAIALGIPAKLLNPPDYRFYVTWPGEEEREVDFAEYVLALNTAGIYNHFTSFDITTGGTRLQGRIQVWTGAKH